MTQIHRDLQHFNYARYIYWFLMVGFYMGKLYFQTYSQILIKYKAAPC